MPLLASQASTFNFNLYTLNPYQSEVISTLYDGSKAFITARMFCSMDYLGFRLRVDLYLLSLYAGYKTVLQNAASGSVMQFMEYPEQTV